MWRWRWPARPTLARSARAPRSWSGWRSPYITHPVAVAMLVQRFGCTEDQVVEALLHDVPEEEGGAGVV